MRLKCTQKHKNRDSWFKNFLNDKLSVSFIKTIIKINTFYAFVNTFNEYLIKTAEMVVKSDSKYFIVVVWRFKIIF